MNKRLVDKFLARGWEIKRKFSETLCSCNSIKTFRILLYHSIHPFYHISIHPDNFERQMKFLVDNKFRVISLDSLQEHLDSEEKGNFIILSFDDGYNDNFEYAFPILKKFNLPAIIFLATRFINQDKFNNCHRKAGLYLGLKFLTWKKIDLMSFHSISFGSHTHSHIDLGKASLEDIEQEIITSKEMIEKNTGKSTHFFAYPFGGFNNFSSNTIKILSQLGFRFACSNIWGSFGKNFHPYILPRCLIEPNDTLDDFQSKISGNWDYLRYINLVKGWIKKVFY